MSAGPVPARPGSVSRRAMLESLARWSVPTVLTIALASRTAAAASCPPCTRRTGARCRACTTNQILNCQCEPCLGAPYCSGAAAPAHLQGAQAPPLGRTQQTSPLFDLNPNPLYRSPFQPSPFNPSPYGTRPLGTLRDSTARSRGSLYDRLRSDQRRPF